MFVTDSSESCNKIKNKKYYTVRTILKYYTVRTILKYYTVGTILKYYTVGTILKYHTVGTILTQVHDSSLHYLGTDISLKVAR